MNKHNKYSQFAYLSVGFIQKAKSMYCMECILIHILAPGSQLEIAYIGSHERVGASAFVHTIRERASYSESAPSYTPQFVCFCEGGKWDTFT